MNEEEHGEILLLSGYPFYVQGPPQDVLAHVTAQVKANLIEACAAAAKDGDEKPIVVVAVDRFGSSAIPGMPGTPVCDVLAQISPWPLSDLAKRRLAKAGFDCQGISEHHADGGKDEWFFCGAGTPGHLGRAILHTVPAGHAFVWHMQAFVDYVKSHPDAYKRYADAKVKAARNVLLSKETYGRLSAYKVEKNVVCKQVKQEAIAWWEATHEEMCNE